MKRLVWSLVRAGMLLAVCIFASSSTASATIWFVDMPKDVFDPDSLTISAGDSVLWTNSDDEEHTVTSGEDCIPDGIWNSGDIEAGESFLRAFDDAGTFPYYCFYHCSTGMTGTIFVVPPTAVDPSTWGRIKALYQ